MLTEAKKDNQRSLFFSLGDSLGQRHPLSVLANEVDWTMFEHAFQALYCQDNRAPCKPIHLMVSLLIFKYVRNLSDESVVGQWSENNYYQSFCGMQAFPPQVPCVSSELVHFRHHIGVSGCELIIKESIRINGKDGVQSDVSADTTVQEKDITYPTDNKL